MISLALAKEEIRQAIIAKGVEVSAGASLCEFAEKISMIKVADNNLKDKKISKKKEGYNV